MIAVHFGAGNIGRGFIGCLLEEAGYEVVFLDVNSQLVEILAGLESYQVIETGEAAKNHTIKNFRAINSATQTDQAIATIASADIVTTSVGVTHLRGVAPLIAKGLEMRNLDSQLLVMACENSIGATDILKMEIEQLLPGSASKAHFANTAVDRIVPIQAHDENLNVLVESFCEWVIETSGIVGPLPNIPGATFVSDLTPFIERKLFTVNTGHCALAYLGQLDGVSTILEATENHSTMRKLEGVLRETSQVLVSRHGFDESEHADYVRKTISRFKNPDLNDSILRVGREPARKLSRNDRLIGPAAFASENGLNYDFLLETVAAALRFTDENDPSVIALHEKMRDSTVEEFVIDVMGIHPSHPLSKQLTECVKNIK